METFYSIHSQQADADSVIQDIVASLSEAPGEYNFGFLYATDAMAADYERLLQACKQQSGITHWIGTVGMGVISDAQEHYDTPAASLMLAQFDPNSFTMLPSLSNIDELDAVTTPFDVNVALVHGDPYCEHAQDIIQQLATRLENGFMIGGLTSSRDLQLQLSDAVTTGGVSGVVFSENIPIATNLSQGCSPIGNKHRISKSEQNVIIKLDEASAVDVVMQDTGASDLDDLRERASDVFVGLCIPGSDRSDYKVRNIVGMDPEKGLLGINDYLTEGNELIFCRRDAESATRDMRDMLERLKARISTQPRGGLYVSCLGRGREQFGDNSEEIALIKDVLGDIPLTGFFANGEIHHDKLYGYTGVLTLFL